MSPAAPRSFCAAALAISLSSVGNACQNEQPAPIPDAERPGATGAPGVPLETKADAQASDPLPDASVPMFAVTDRRRFQPYPEVYFTADNPWQNEKALLGKILFWDEQLSDDNTVACGTCHRPSAGGADPRPAQPGYRGHPGPDGLRGTRDDPRGSPGIASCVSDADAGVEREPDPLFEREVQVTRRRSMSMADAMFWPVLFWDGRAGTPFRDPLAPDTIVLSRSAALETQALMPLVNTVEMACKQSSLSHLALKLRHSQPLALARDWPDDVRALLAQHPDYPALFEASFGTRDITAVRIALALATYERSLTSNQTPWDKWQAGDDAALTPEQLEGFAFFVDRGGCSCCHAPPLFGSQLMVNDGFSLSMWDQGRAEVTSQPRDSGAFRAPGLRNVGLRERGGLLHDGLAPGNSLEALVDAYAEPPLVGGNAVLCVRRGFDADATTRAALVAFLRHALTDPRMQREQAPFDRPTLSSEH